MKRKAAPDGGCRRARKVRRSRPSRNPNGFLNLTAVMEQQELRLLGIRLWRQQQRQAEHAGGSLSCSADEVSPF